MDESFLPYAMIEPLLEEGMTGKDLREKLYRLTGLDPSRYQFWALGDGLRLRDALKGGVQARKTQVPFHPKWPYEPVR